MSALAKLRMVQIVLLWAWDPIGVRGIPEAVDEYDSYAPEVLELLEAGASDRSIADYLTGVTRDRMELLPDPKAHADIAAMLRQLHAIDA